MKNDPSKWAIVAQQGNDEYLIDTKEPDPSAMNDTLCRLYYSDDNTISIPVPSVGRFLKQGYWSEYKGGKTAAELVSGAREISDPAGTEFTGVKF